MRKKFNALLHEQAPRYATIAITEGMNHYEAMKKLCDCFKFGISSLWATVTFSPSLAEVLH
jgi:hypothetical protein